MLVTIVEALKIIDLKRNSPRKPRQKESTLAKENVSNDNIEPILDGARHVGDSRNLQVDLKLSPENKSFLCPSCAQNVDEGAIFCDMCENWFHFECEQIPVSK